MGSVEDQGEVGLDPLFDASHVCQTNVDMIKFSLKIVKQSYSRLDHLGG